MSTIGDTLVKKKRSILRRTSSTEENNRIITEETVLTKEERVINNDQVNEESVQRIAYLSVKRFFDVFWAVIGCSLLLPILCIVKISYLATGDKGSIFYTQKRIGKNGKEFKLLKIRSMVTNSAEVLQELLKDEKYRKEWEENQKLENDPRITKVGKWLRKTSLDEFPQFINILKGDMSLIGPRPLVEGELDQHGGNHEIYESMRPGLTGWWGCNGRSSTTYQERLELEYYYISNASIVLDLKIIFKTLKVLTKTQGAK